MSIFSKAAKLGKKAVRLAVENPEIALALAGAVSPKLARKAVKAAPKVRRVVKAVKGA